MKKKNILISLPYCSKHGSFKVKELVEEFQRRVTDFMIVGAQNHSYRSHTKPESLDYWLRSLVIVQQRDTRQVCKSVLNEIVASGYFELGKRRCPVSNVKCKALILV